MSVETATFPQICSGTPVFICFSNLSKQVAINSIQIHTSLIVIKQPRQTTISLQSWDLSTTSMSMTILFVSSEFPVRRICLHAIIFPVSLCFIMTTFPQVPFPRSPLGSRSVIGVLYFFPSIVSTPVSFMISSSFRSYSSRDCCGKLSNFNLALDSGSFRLTEVGFCLLVRGDVSPILDGSPTREGRGRTGRAEREPPGLGVGLNAPDSSADGNFSCFILALRSSVLDPILRKRFRFRVQVTIGILLSRFRFNTMIILNNPKFILKNTSIKYKKDKLGRIIFYQLIKTLIFII